mgnify:CR=1 FL=1
MAVDADAVAITTPTTTISATNPISTSPSQATYNTNPTTTITAITITVIPKQFHTSIGQIQELLIRQQLQVLPR